MPRGKRQQTEKPYRASGRLATTPQRVTRSMAAAARRSQEQQAAREASRLRAISPPTAPEESRRPSVSQVPSIPSPLVEHHLLPSSSNHLSSPSPQIMSSPAQAVASFRVPSATPSPSPAPTTSPSAIPAFPPRSLASPPNHHQGEGMIVKRESSTSVDRQGVIQVNTLDSNPDSFSPSYRGPGEDGTGNIKDESDEDEIQLNKIPERPIYLRSEGGVIFRDPFAAAAAAEDIKGESPVPAHNQRTGSASPRTVRPCHSRPLRAGGHPFTEQGYFLPDGHPGGPVHHERDVCTDLLPSMILPPLQTATEAGGQYQAQPTLPWVGDLVPVSGLDSLVDPSLFDGMIPPTSVYPSPPFNFTAPPAFAGDYRNQRLSSPSPVPEGVSFLYDPTAPTAFMGRYITSPPPPWRQPHQSLSASPELNGVFWRLENQPEPRYVPHSDDLPMDETWRRSSGQFPADGTWDLDDDYDL